MKRGIAMAKRSYNWNAADYAQHSSGQFQWAQELIEKLDLTGSETLLDVGCGDGKVTAAIYECLPQGRVVGIDSSPGMIELASRAFPKETYPRLRFQLMDVLEMDFEEGFDVLFSNAALHWVKDHRPLLRKVGKALKPGGRILFQMGGKGNARDMVGAMEALAQRAEWALYFDGFQMPYGFHGMEEYREWLEEVGMGVKRIELIPKDMVHPGREGLTGWVRTTWLPYLDRVPDEKRSTFIEELISLYLQIHPLDENGMAHVGMVRLEVEAVAEDLSHRK